MRIEKKLEKTKERRVKEIRGESEEYSVPKAKGMMDLNKDRTVNVECF